MMLIFQVHFRAYRKNIPIIPRSELSSVSTILKTRWYLSLPLFILIILLVMQFTPLFAGVYAIAATVVVSLFRRDTRLDLKRLLATLADGAKNAAPIAMACACAGIVVGVITLTGLGMKFSSMIVSFAHGSLFLGIISAWGCRWWRHMWYWPSLPHPLWPNWALQSSPHILRSCGLLRRPISRRLSASRHLQPRQ
jgi:TRAP-type uncharacterized transport system fused permease subunit